MAANRRTKRALRRHHLARMKARCRRIFPHDVQAKLANHLKSWSCPCCCNRRKIEGDTLQERRRRDRDASDGFFPPN